MKLSEDLPKHWIIVKALLFGVIVIFCLALLLITDNRLHEIIAAFSLMWASARLYYFCFYVISTYLDSSYQFTGITSSIVWILTRFKTRPKD